MLSKKLTGKLNSHLSRWLVGIILLPIVIYCIFSSSDIPFVIVMLTVGSVMWWEFTNHFLGKERLGLFFICILAWLFFGIISYIYGIPGQQVGLVVALALGAVYSMVGLNKQANPVLVNVLSRYSLGHLYISFLFSFLFLMKKSVNGNYWILYVLLATVIADTCAFYAGSKLKGPKIYPKISPNKTYSGLLGGILGSVIFSLIFYKFIPNNDHKLSQMLILGAIIGLWGPFGDFFESFLKRAVQIKDSSGILLGHGGFLDRLDALLFNVPLVYLYLEWTMFQ